MSSRARYYLYRNLHTNSFSIKYKNKVIERPKNCLMYNVIFKVSKKGQARVRKEKRKNVHATLAAQKYLVLDNKPDLTEYQEIYYNPYTTDTFIDRDGKQVFLAEHVLCLNNKIYVKSKGKI